MRFSNVLVCRIGCLAAFLVAVFPTCAVPGGQKGKLPLLIAHRGAGDLDGRKPEATKAAYSNAVATACDVVKLDVQRTRDGVIVMSHVNWYDRPEGGYAIGTMPAKVPVTREELMQSVVDYCGRFGPYGVNMPRSLTTDDEVAFLHAHGVRWVSLYFVQDADQARDRFKAGADAYVTDHVSKVREGLAAAIKGM